MRALALRLDVSECVANLCGELASRSVSALGTKMGLKTDRQAETQQN